MSQTTYHDAVKDDIEGIAFLAHNSIVDYSFLWWHTYSFVAEAAYWWKEFDRCNLERYMLFTDYGQCNKFSKVSANYGIDPGTCIVVPPSLYATFADTRHAWILNNVHDEEAALSILSTHYSRPESH